MWSADAPAKAILFGEHAVLYGAPAIAIAIDLRASVSLEKSEKWLLNGDAFNPLLNPHLGHLISEFGDLDNPLSISIDSTIPMAAGLGSSAALSVASGMALSASRGHNSVTSIESLARAAHRAEASAQGGRASPTDTSVSTLGGAVIVSSSRIKSLEHRWAIDLESPDGSKHWDVHSLSIPSSLSRIPIVIGFTGISSSTKKMVEMVANNMQTSSFRLAMEKVSEISQKSIDILSTGNPEAIGDAMTRCHSLLQKIGVSSTELDNLIDAVLPFSFGAKLTGAGGGGCIIALSNEPQACAEEINKCGGIPYITSFAEIGVKISS
ncbi:MAG: mevalonate kinase [Euryarchaeota archaeon]|nr:mevalonate kinase [Euryarchaeota archaeon]